MHLVSLRRTGHLFGTPFRLGVDEAPVEPAPEPPPAPEPEPMPAPEPEPPPPPPPPPPITSCKPVGKPFVDNGICYQMFECHTDGTVTFEKRNAQCPPQPAPWNVAYPYPYLFPVTTYPPTTTRVVVEQPAPAAPDIKQIAPYAIGAVAAVGILYAIFK